jgi:hypothetical protein
MKRALRAARAAGFTLLPVVLAMSLIAAIAFLLNRDNGMNAAMIASGSDLDRARYAAEAGLQAVNYQVQQQGCGGGFPTPAAPVTNSNFGGGSYAAYADKATGSPLLLSSTGSYNGASVTLSRANVQVFKSGMQTTPLVGAQDTYVESGSPTWNYGGNSALRLRTGNDEMLLQFNLSSLPAGSRVIPYANAGVLQPGATLYLYQSANSASSGTISAYLITQSWVGGTLNGGVPASGAGATWNTYDGNTAHVWGVGYDSRALYNATAAYVVATGWYSWDITDAAAAWMGGVYPNYGLWMKSSSGNISNTQYVSTDDTTNTTEHPYVTLNYLAPCAPTGGGGTTTTVTLYATQDTWIDAAHATANYGNDISFTVTNASKAGRGLVQFDLSGIPAGTLLQSATLRLFTGSFTANGNPTSTLTVNPVQAPWTETGATWKTANGSSNSWLCGCFGGNFGAAAASATISSSFTAGSVEWVVTGLAQQWVDGIIPNYGAGVLTGTTSTVYFNSRTAPVNPQYLPQLVITY